MNRSETYFVTILFLLFSLFIPSNAQPGTVTQRLYLSGTHRADPNEWEFFCTDGMNSGKWTRIQVPSNWETEGFGIYNYGHDHKTPGVKLGTEQGFYKKRFTVPNGWKGRKINIVFEGVMTDAVVQVNGKPAGEKHQGAFYRFKHDISGLVKFGRENLLEVEVSKHSSNESVNEAERYADYWIFGGIFRPVYLESLPRTHMERVALDAKADGSIRANIFLQGVGGPVEFEFTLADRDSGQIVGTRTISPDYREEPYKCEMTFPGIEPWNPEYPHMYSLDVSLMQNGKVVHTIREKIGFRTVQLLPQDGIYVNGKKILLKGVNRHSFNPHTGRSLSESDHLTDVGLMKDMNMNAVRMSHYPPDEKFLEICDSAGLFVLDELAGWQAPYDTIVGPKLIREMILNNENHPSVIIWDHGNEGGWNFSNEKWFHYYDIQKRPVIYPQVRRNDVDAFHYPSFIQAMSRLVADQEIFIPTELLHGLYDAGMGAGLYDYWNAFRQNPAFSGGFLWNLRDEALWRTDLNKYDTDGNHAPDGILGPNGEKEGSYFTVKEIWSPVRIKPFSLNDLFNGELILENEFLYTNLKDCSFNWELVKAGRPEDPAGQVVRSGYVEAPDIGPGEAGSVRLSLPSGLADSDIFRFKAFDAHGREIFTWSRAIRSPSWISARNRSLLHLEKSKLSVEPSKKVITATTGEMEFRFSSKDGTLLSVKNSKGPVSFGGGPVPLGIKSQVEQVSWFQDDNDILVITCNNEAFPEYFTWKLHPDGILELEVSDISHDAKDLEYLGVSFTYPEESCRAVRWMGKGPYRVYKNRMHGPQMGVWEKEYNNTITGQSYDSLIYPEFKGYHADLYWARFITDESDFSVYCETPGVFLKLYTPEEPEAPRDARVSYPEGDISFMFDISPIGTKFHEPSEMGPNSMNSTYKYRSSDLFRPMKLWFDFHVHAKQLQKFDPVSKIPGEIPFEFNLDILPQIPDADFNILDYMDWTDGGREFSGGLEAAIDEASAAGGRRIIIPPGTWYTGPIHLKSNINLHISEHATVHFSSDLRNYLPVVYSSHQGIECYKYRPMIYADGERNIAITGKGTFHGRGNDWKEYNKYKEVGWENLVRMVENGLPLEERVFDDSTEHFLPPFHLQFVNCENILIEDNQFKYVPFWNLNPLYCKNLLIRNINIESRGKERSSRNGDGIALSSCQNALIQGCTLCTGDNCLVIKSGRDKDGIKLGIPSENIVITDCLSLEGHGGVVLGSETSGGIRNVLVESCEFRGTSRGIRLKTARRRGAYVKNIYFRNIIMEDISSQAIIINMLRYTPRYPAFPAEPTTPVYRNINIENVKAENVMKHGIQLTGLPEMPMIEIRLKNIEISSRMGFLATDAEDVVVENLRLETDQPKAA